MQILLADDQPEVRSALRLLLEQESGLNVCAEAGDATTLLALAQVGSPDLLLMDWELPGCPAADTLSLFRFCCPHATVIALSGRLGAREAALAAGVDCFISKGEPPERLLDTIRNAWEGK